MFVKPFIGLGKLYKIHILPAIPDVTTGKLVNEESAIVSIDRDSKVKFSTSEIVGVSVTGTGFSFSLAFLNGDLESHNSNQYNKTTNRKLNKTD